MKEKIISEIIREMLSSLNNEQLSKLKATLEIYRKRQILRLG